MLLLTFGKTKRYPLPDIVNKMENDRLQSFRVLPCLRWSSKTTLMVFVIRMYKETEEGEFLELLQKVPKNDRICVLEQRGNIMRSVNDNASFTII